MLFEAKNSTFLCKIQIQIQQNTWDGKFFFFQTGFEVGFYSKKVEFLASNIIIWTKFLIATPLGPIGRGCTTQILVP